MAQVITQRHIARRLGITQQAVGYALSGRSDLRKKLNPQTQRRVVETARKLGYVPHSAARRLARARQRTSKPGFDQVGLLYLTADDCDIDPVCLIMMGAAEHEISDANASLCFLRVRKDADWKKVERVVRAGGVDGWLLYGLVNEQAVKRLEQMGSLPHVILGDDRCVRAVHGVNVDNVAVGQLAVHHLAALGHRRIAFLGSSLEFVYQREALKGFRAALSELGLDQDERLITDHSVFGRSSDLIFEKNFQRVVEWLGEAGPRPTALFAYEFEWPAEMYRVLRQTGLEMPGDMSLLACAPATRAAASQNFTRIVVPVLEIGRQGAALLRQIVAEPSTPPRQIKLAPALVTGWSTGPAKQLPHPPQAPRRDIT